MIINPIISASGGLKPKIVVTAPTGSAVTCTTPGGIVLTAIEISGTWTFADLPGSGTYTINAALGTKSKTESVPVDRVGVFEVEIIYRLYLYNEGDECTDVTGGWEFHFDYSSSYAQTNTKKESDHMKLVTQGGATWPDTCVYTKNKIDLDGYSKLGIDYRSQLTSGTSNRRCCYALNTQIQHPGDGVVHATLPGETESQIGRIEITIDITNRTESLYVAPYIWGYSSNIDIMFVYKVWLE